MAIARTYAIERGRAVSYTKKAPSRKSVTGGHTYFTVLGVGQDERKKESRQSDTGSLLYEGCPEKWARPRKDAR